MLLIKWKISYAQERRDGRIVLVGKPMLYKEAII